ncbi:MAG: biotin--[acetyl-CoA-carboxylase] ligase [Nitrospinae bacterium]|nr:biotin--[acetyl-CoA-carboxylase] ligase [Nitrospinota bacterium]
MTYDHKTDAAKIKNNLDCVLIGSEIVFLPEIDSTNDLVKGYLENNAEEGLVVIAETQTAGKGRFGRTWHSPAEAGIYLSVLLKPRLAPDHLPRLTLMAGVAAVCALNQFSRRRATLKWPNDILIRGKKVCGLLCEHARSSEGTTGVVIGVGINVNHLPGQFPEELKATATSLLIENDAPVERVPLIRSFLNHLDQEYQTYLMDGGQEMLRKWGDNTDLFEKQVTVTRGSDITCGTALRLDESGRLVVRTENGNEESFDSGEVTLRTD